MRRLEHYISADGKLLRCGYTTGTCAVAATRAATELLLGNVLVPSVLVSTPSGVEVLVEVEEARRGSLWACATVVKDAGDDSDVTNGVQVEARVELAEVPGIVIEGGVGVGHVTMPGLDQPVGAAAINSVPRRMIEEAAREAAQAWGYTGGLAVEISVPDGADIARRTFNPRLGIEGGISILGTSGIVRPMSEEALIESLKLELRVLKERGVEDLLVVPGNYGRDFATQELGLSAEHMVSCGNYLGVVLDEAALLGFGSLLLVGHLGKLSKVAAGVMNTHSRVADCRMEVLAAHAALAGASRECVSAIMTSVTTDAVLELLDQRDLLAPVMASMTERLYGHLASRVAGRLQVGAVVFSKVYGVLGVTEGAEVLMARHAISKEGI